jgi:hypothetical protein
VTLDLGPRLREALDTGTAAKLTLAPYSAFVSRDGLRIR